MNALFFARSDVALLVGAVALPILPPLLTIVRLEELVTPPIKIVF